MKSQQRNPHWWNEEHDSGWDGVKAACKRDWEQTKHDLGGKPPDTDQGVSDTVKQAAGKQPIPPRGQPTFEQTEDAYRFGFGARSQYRLRFSNWDDQLENQLRQDWNQTYKDRDWARYRDFVRRGWDYDENEGFRRAA